MSAAPHYFQRIQKCVCVKSPVTTGTKSIRETQSWLWVYLLNLVPRWHCMTRKEAYGWLYSAVWTHSDPCASLQFSSWALCLLPFSSPCFIWVILSWNIKVISISSSPCLMWLPGSSLPCNFFVFQVTVILPQQFFLTFPWPSSLGTSFFFVVLKPPWISLITCHAAVAYFKCIIDHRANGLQEAAFVVLVSWSHVSMFLALVDLGK